MARQHNESDWMNWVEDPGFVPDFDPVDVGVHACADAVVSVLIDYAPRHSHGWEATDAKRVADACSESYGSASGEAEGYRNLGETYVTQHALAAYTDTTIVVDYEATGRAVAKKDLHERVAIWHSCGACRMLHRFDYRAVTRAR